MPHSIEITDEDVDLIARALGLEFSDKRAEALKCTTSVDVQACPGSGKTTLLVAKLCILMSKWRWRDRGICILSHTNVAREEIEKRLTQFPHAMQLFSYPHFVGTIQTFIDQFLALSHLRDAGIEVRVVDNEWFERRSLQLLYQFPKTKFSLGQRRNGFDLVKGLRLISDTLSLGSANGAFHFGEHTQTFKDLQSLKDLFCKEGIFRYDDMCAFAEAHLARYPNLSDAFKHRFPWVFIDEMQDTDGMMYGVLTKIFHEGCIVQRFGDVNQAIFRDDTTNEDTSNFPDASGFIEISESKRFGARIAQCSSHLTAATPQQLSGNANCTDKQDTLFLFDKDSISEVLPAFGKLVLEELSAKELSGLKVKAIGAVGKISSGDKFPYSIGDYWASFNPRTSTISSKPESLIDYVRKARHLRLQTEECQDAYNLVLDGIVEFLRRQDAVNHQEEGFTKQRLIQLFEEGSREQGDFQGLVLECCLAEGILSEESWSDTVEKLTCLLFAWTGDSLQEDAATFLAWQDDSGATVSNHRGEPQDLVNTCQYVDNDSGRSIEIELSTIHSVKGETHAATLVFETHFNKYDLKELLPFLKQERGFSTSDSQRIKGWGKKVFVGMTRPRYLLCLAMHKEHVGQQDIESLRQAGWTIHDLVLTE